MSKPITESVVLKLVLNGYLPLSKNHVRRLHWTGLVQEKIRTAHHLKLCLESMPPDQMIGTTLGPKSVRTCLSQLESYMMTNGMFSVAKSSLARPKQSPKKKQK